MRIIAISDIHGHLNEFKDLLIQTKFDINKDKLYLLGDYVDKGKQSKEVIQHIMELDQHSNVKIIGGNHDDMFLNWLDNNDYKLSPYTSEKNAGTETILSFSPFFKVGENDNEVRNFIKENFKKEIDFLRNLSNYIEDEEHIFVHAGIDPKEEDWKKTKPKDFRWIRQKFYNEKHSLSKTVVFGHTVTAKIREDLTNFDVWFSDKKIGIDGGSKFGGQLNALEIVGTNYKTFFVKTPNY